jgi:hypothetical protein
MKEEYKKAIKAGLIGALLIVIVRLITDVIAIEGLFVFAIYLLTGALVAYFIAPDVKGTSWGYVIVHDVFVGSTAGAIAKVVSSPFTILFELAMKLYPAYKGPGIDFWPWLGIQLMTQFGIMLAIAIILSTVAALACGVVLKAFGKNKAAA